MATATWVRRMHLLFNFKRFRLSDGNVHLFTGVNAPSTNATHFHRTGTLSHRTSYGFTLFGFKTINPKFFQLKWPVRNITNQLHGRYKKLQDSSVVCGRYFHTSEARRAAPILPVIGAALAKFSGPIAKSLKLLAVLGGRTFRKWWRKLPVHKREKFKENLFSRMDVIFLILSSLVGGWLFLYYIHLEETPYTKRSRYVGVTPNQIRDIAETQWRKLLETHADDIVSVAHPDHKRVYRIAERLIRANADEKMDQLNWEVNVISSEQTNAFVLPNGQIFVFSGLLRFLPSDDALAIILGHEIAHAILQHSAEQLCFHGFINLIKVVLLATIWALLPNDVLAFLTQSIQNALLGACFDVREGPRVWQRFGALEKEQEESSVEWLSTHPSHENRERNLEDIVPEALALRKLCECPELPGVSVTREKVKPLTLTSMAGIYNTA